MFDNAQTPGDLVAWLPGGTGHVLITTRATGWGEVAAAVVEVDVFARPESTAILTGRVPGLAETEADSLAAVLGDLPLGIAQAASYLADSHMPPAEYMHLVTTRAARVLAEGRVASYPRSLAGAVQLTIERLTTEHPGAATLAQIGAFLAPEPVPLAWFTTAAAQLPPPLGASAADPLAWRNLLTALGRSALARGGRDTMQMHRLIQAILRDRLTPDQAAATRALADTLLAANDPGAPRDPASWPGWARLLPHITATSPATTSPALRDLACDAAGYLVRRGDARGAQDLVDHLYQQWQHQLGSDDRHTMRAANTLAIALRHLGKYTQARRLDEDTLARQQRLHGKDHQSTLTSASNLAINLAGLGEYRAARELDEDVLARRRRVLGEDHPDTMTSASDLSGLGEYRAARELDEDVLARRRRVLGEDHPDTLTSASNLGVNLAGLGEYRAARELDEDVLARRRRVLGEDHPDTLTSASNLAVDLRELVKQALSSDVSLCHTHRLVTALARHLGAAERRR